jgi:quinol monooxygenase YgiN
VVDPAAHPHRLSETILAKSRGGEHRILYALHRGVDDPSRLAFIERWASREELDAHLSSPHVQEILTRAEELFGDSADIVAYEPMPGGEAKKGSLVGARRRLRTPTAAAGPRGRTSRQGAVAVARRSLSSDAPTAIEITVTITPRVSAVGTLSPVSSP